MDRRQRDIEKMFTDCGVPKFKLLRCQKHYVYELTTPYGPRKIVMSRSPAQGHRHQKNRAIVDALMTEASPKGVR